MNALRWASIPALACSLACVSGPVGPATVDTLHDQCDSCRMILSDARTAAQIAAPGEEPRFFDDLRCLREALRAGPPLPGGAVVFVVDYRTGAWSPAAGAVFVRLPDAETPMASHWVAYSDDASRRADPRSAGGADVPAAEILGPEGRSGGGS